MKDTRPTGEGRIVRRRRCPDCHHDFHTVEQLSELGVRVRKSDATVVPFDRETLRESISKAAVRPFEPGTLDRLIDAVLAEVQPAAQAGPVPTSQVGESVLRRLREEDEVSHIRFALVHTGRLDRSDGRRGWKDVADVRRWLLENYPGLEHARPSARLSKVLKRDGRREPFSRRKLERSIGVASKGRGTRDEVHQLAIDVAEDVEREIGDQPLVTSGQLAAEILRSLRHRDQIAFLRFASTAKRYVSAYDYEEESFALRSQT